MYEAGSLNASSASSVVVVPEHEHDVSGVASMAALQDDALCIVGMGIVPYISSMTLNFAF